MAIDRIGTNNNLNSYTVSSANRKNKSDSENFSSILNSVSSGNKTADLDQIFEKASEKYHVPVNLLKAVAKAESNFNAKAQSGAGAQGIMQLMPATARSLGVTDSFDAEQNIMGGAKYLSKMMQKFEGNMQLALAAYNAGPGNVSKYGGIPPFKETQNYVKKVMGYCGNDFKAGTVPDSPDKADGSDTRILQHDMQFPSIAYDAAVPDEIADAIFINLLQYQLNISLFEDFGLTKEQGEDGI